MFFDEHRYLVLKGGGGSGKSVFAAQKIIDRVTGEPGHRYLVIRKVARTLRQSCWTNLIERLERDFPGCEYKVNRTDMVISFQNGSEILFAGVDDVEKLKSIQSITGIWIEEASELEKGDFNQLDIRLRTTFPFYLQIILTFNPISITHWLKERFFDKKDERARVDESTFRDNRFLPEENIRTMEGFKDTDPYYYQVYFLGQWGVTGKTVFDGVAVSRRLEQIKGQKIRSGYFVYDEAEDGVHIFNWRFVEDADGPVRIYREPEAGRPYVAGGDTAGDGSDWFVGQVLDNVTGKLVCKLRHQYDEDTYAKQLYCLGMYYNEALLGVETNLSTYPVKLLDLMGYRKLYVREVEDEFDGKIRHAFGFRTDRITRPVILAELIRVMREHMELVSDEDTLLEMLTFVRNDKLRMEAEEGAHDDCVMALAIAHYIRPQQTMTVQTQKNPDKNVWTKDMWEDYYRADEAGRRYMLANWGEPKR